MTKVLVATPTFDGSVRDEYLLSLMQSRELVDFDLLLIPGIHFVDTARDVAAAKFLQSDADVLFFIDSDLGWPADAFKRLIDRNLNVVGGAYPIKHDRELYPVFADKSEHGLTKAHGLPGGFLCIKRRVIERLAGVVPHYAWATGERFIDVPAIFKRELVDGRLISEDLMFCRRALAAGFDLWLDKDISFRHAGIKSWRGNYQEFEHASHGA